MILNYIWVSFFLIAFVVALIKLIFFHDMEVFPKLLDSTFEMAKTGFTISLSLTGVMTLWLGLMKIGEKGGIVPILAKVVGPFFSRLFPGVPPDHPANGSIIMNFSANMLGLDNAATPIGLKAMKELQEINPDKETASNAQIMFLVLNTSGLTIIPLAIIADRAAMGSVNPTSIFIPTLIATFFSTMAGLIYVCIKQRIRLFDPVLLAYLLGLIAFIASVIWYFTQLPQDELQRQSTLASSVIIISVIVGFILLGLRRKLPLFDTFIDGAKEGFEIAIKIIPYLVAILVGIGLFRTSGALDYITNAIKWGLTAFNLNTDFVDALPVALMKPLSAASARAMMIAISEPAP
ncbi:MAG TPA: nucleoside recognition domain-containing protein, partial [Ohtaekwangia sp.]|nr:nucleoside recognition domain-containing protein [Ohtaekwangia sp.]